MEKEAVNHENHKPHCLILPFPLQGHINPMLQFAKRLSHNGINITLAITKHLINTISQTFPTSISVKAISDGYDEGRNPDEISLKVYLDRFRQVGPESFSELLQKLGQYSRPVDCVIYDPFLPWGLAVAKKFGIFGAAFFTQSNSVNSIYYSIYKGWLTVPLSEKENIVVPGLPTVLEFSDMPSFVRDPESFQGSFELVVDQFRDVEEADFVFVNSVYELEVEVTDWMAKLMRVKTIGPTVPSMYLDKRLPEDKEYGLSFFTPINSCMEWLDQRARKSVIYASFGSMAQFDKKQMEELALGLKMTNNYFLWVVRSSEESKLPENFAQEILEKGLIVSWCPQLEVLAHKSIGCFLTHCGWNSTLEGLSLGVPMVVVPFWSDQSTNAKFVMDVWKMGVRARPDSEDVVRREEIVSCVNYVMGGEGGEEVRENARKLGELVRGAVDDGGTSDRNIREFVSTIRGDMPSK